MQVISTHSQDEKNKLLIENLLINPSEPKQYGVYLHATFACNERIRVII